MSEDNKDASPSGQDLQLHEQFVYNNSSTFYKSQKLDQQVNQKVIGEMEEKKERNVDESDKDTINPTMDSKRIIVERPIEVDVQNNIIVVEQPTAGNGHQFLANISPANFSVNTHATNSSNTNFVNTMNNNNNQKNSNGAIGSSIGRISSSSSSSSHNFSNGIMIDDSNRQNNGYKDVLFTPKKNLENDNRNYDRTILNTKNRLEREETYHETQSLALDDIHSPPSETISQMTATVHPSFSNQFLLSKLSFLSFMKNAKSNFYNKECISIGLHQVTSLFSKYFLFVFLFIFLQKVLQMRFIPPEADESYFSITYFLYFGLFFLVFFFCTVPFYYVSLMIVKVFQAQLIVFISCLAQVVLLLFPFIYILLESSFLQFWIFYVIFGLYLFVENLRSQAITELYSRFESNLQKHDAAITRLIAWGQHPLAILIASFILMFKSGYFVTLLIPPFISLLSAFFSLLFFSSPKFEQKERTERSRNDHHDYSDDQISEAETDDSSIMPSHVITRKRMPILSLKSRKKKYKKMEPTTTINEKSTFDKFHHHISVQWNDHFDLLIQLIQNPFGMSLIIVRAFSLFCFGAVFTVLASGYCSSTSLSMFLAEPAFPIVTYASMVMLSSSGAFIIPYLVGGIMLFTHPLVYKASIVLGFLLSSGSLFMLAFIKPPSIFLVHPTYFTLGIMLGAIDLNLTYMSLEFKVDSSNPYSSSESYDHVTSVANLTAFSFGTMITTSIHLFTPIQTLTMVFGALLALISIFCLLWMIFSSKKFKIMSSNNAITTSENQEPQDDGEAEADLSLASTNVNSLQVTDNITESEEPIMYGKDKVKSIRKELKRRLLEMDPNIISNGNLDNTLADGNIRECFKLFCELEHSHENVEFWEVVHLRYKHTSNGSQRKELAQNLYETYISENGSKTLNFSSVLRRAIENACTSPDFPSPQLFDSCVASVEKDLMDSFLRFQNYHHELDDL